MSEAPQNSMQQALSPAFRSSARTLYQQWNQDVSQSATARSTPIDTMEGGRNGNNSVHDLDAFLHYINSPESNAMAPSVLDGTHPISDYYISSSHNTYLSGSQLYGKASTQAYADVLMRGARCVEIDVWDGVAAASQSDSEDEDDASTSGMKGLRQRFKKSIGVFKGHTIHHKSSDAEQGPGEMSTSQANSSTSPARRIEPRVLHGHTLTHEVSFRAVCETIRDYAFQKSDLPIIVSLETHVCHEQQQMMVDIMRSTWGDYLLDADIEITPETRLPSLDSLKKRILIKVKYSSPKQVKEREASVQSAGLDGAPDSSDGESQMQSVNKGKIIPQLGNMGIYTRACHFKSFDQPEASLPTHVFAISESKVLDLHKRDPNALFRHNKQYLMRAYPKAVRVTSTNLDPAPFWREGIQMVALNWQHINEGTMLNEAMFSSTGGWVLKPEGYRSSHESTSKFTAIRKGTLDLSVELFAGQDIGCGKRRYYIRSELHVEESENVDDMDKPDGMRSKDGQIKAVSDAARGEEDLDFGGQTLSFRGVSGVADELSFFRLKIMSDDIVSRDDLVAWACFRLSRLQQGIRVIKLHDTQGMPTRGRLLVRISKRITP